MQILVKRGMLKRGSFLSRYFPFLTPFALCKQGAIPTCICPCSLTTELSQLLLMSSPRPESIDILHLRVNSKIIIKNDM